ncbi:MAG: hypothetical protein IMZ57_04075 [Acidobacteria bacterium]|nr:hypothetical protein [Acidobacteriota bacterium]
MTSHGDFTENDKAMIEKIAYAVGEVFAARTATRMEEFVKAHHRDCSYGERLRRAFWMGAGIGAGCLLLGIRTIPQVWAWFTDKL